jgi:hypothetical protein
LNYIRIFQRAAPARAFAGSGSAAETPASASTASAKSSGGDIEYRRLVKVNRKTFIVSICDRTSAVGKDSIEY